MRTFGIALLAAAALAACGDVDAEPPRNAVDRTRADGVAGVTGQELSTIGDLIDFDDKFGGGGEGGALVVNRYLWTAALDTLSFLPIVSTDPFSGVIATDWGQSAESPNERFKVTAYVSDVTLQAQSLKVAVFREVNVQGAWRAAPVDPNTPRQIEDAILTKARLLKIEDLRATG